MQSNSVIKRNPTTAGGKQRAGKYLRALEHLSAKIYSGGLQPGDALPTEFDLSQSLGISRNTVRLALDTLAQDGVIHRIPGRGTFVTTNQQRKSREQLDVFALIAPQLREGLYPSLIHGFEESCTTCHHQMLVGNSSNDTGRQAELLLQMIEQSVGGVALVPTTTKPTPAFHLSALRKSHIPVVFCHRTVAGFSAPSVVFSGREVGLLAGRELVRLGHRRIAFLFAHRYPTVDAYEQGLQDAMTQAGQAANCVMPVEYGSSDPAPNLQAKNAIQNTLAELLKRPDRPTAIFCGNAPDAEVIYLQATAMGLRVPQELSLVYVGSSWCEDGLADRITRVVVNEHELGARAAELLHEMRNGKRAIDNDEQIVFPVSILPGETVGPAPKLTNDDSLSGAS